MANRYAAVPRHPAQRPHGAAVHRDPRRGVAVTVLFHVSDLHFGTEDRAALAWFAAEVAAARPDLVLVTGDLTAAARQSEFASASDWLAGLEAPVRLEPGNHDLPVYRPLLRLLDPYRRLRRLMDRHHRPLDLPHVTLVSLKTTTRVQLRRNWSLGSVGSDSLAQALAAARAAAPDTKVIVAAHHPLIDVGTMTPGRTRGGAAALTALAAAGADAVLTGHTHDPFDVPWYGAGRSVRLIGAGTLSERTRDSRPAYNWLTIGPKGIDNAVRAMP